MSQEQNLIPVFEPQIGADTLKAVSDAFEIGWLGMGATTRAFEQGIGAWLGAVDRQVIATNTGTSALHIAVVVAGVEPGDEVIVPSFNFIADHQAISAEGATPVFCDILEENLGIDPDKVAASVTERTKAIMPFHYGGVPCKLNDVFEVADIHGLRVIEDATHAFGTHRRQEVRLVRRHRLLLLRFGKGHHLYRQRRSVVIPDRDDAQRAKRFRLLWTRTRKSRYQNKRAWDYDVVSKHQARPLSAR